MIGTLLDFLQFLFSTSPFLVSLLVWTILVIALSKSIKRHPKAYYWGAALMSTLTLVSYFGMSSELGLLRFGTLPIIEELLIEFAYATYFIHPILVIIMYMGAFSPKTRYIGRLMSIRKELSIIVGFPVIAHALKRIILMVPMSWNHFANYSESITSPRVASVWGSNITHGVFLLGIVMTVLFLILWVTSFDSVHRKMGSRRWKATQRWSYALYAMLFIHSVGIDTGSLMNTYAREEQRAKTQQVEAVAAKDSAASSPHFMMPVDSTAKVNEAAKAAPVKANARHGRSSGFSFAEVKLESKTKLIANISILCALYGSYLFFRLRKARRDRKRRQQKIQHTQK